MALMELSVVPLGLGTPSVGEHIADIQRELAKGGLPYNLTDMGTIIEGSVSDLLSLAARLHELPFAKGVKRVQTVVVIDDRRDKKVLLDDKVKSVQARLK
ncbi:MAG: MTH1187 family thiamine-binding protein [Deltaproteobacteria bacterium]|nr:MTH1187 family thiamine-binding protein [Deltaproteobacteria bacterium]